MKKHFNHFAICCLMISTSALHGQSLTSKNTVELGGDFSFSSQTRTLGGITSNSTYTTLMFDPYIGVMITEGFELGFMPGISSNRQSGSYSSTLTGVNLFLAPAYNFNVGGKAFPYLEFLVGYNSLSGGGVSRTEEGLGVGFSGGIKVAISESSLFLFNVKYLHQNYNNVPYYDDNFYWNGPSYVSESLNTVFAGIGFRVFISPRVKTPAPPGK